MDETTEFRRSSPVILSLPKALLQALEVYFLLAFGCLAIGAFVCSVIVLTAFDYRRKFHVSLKDFLRHPFREWNLLRIWMDEKNYRITPPHLRSSLPEHRLSQMRDDPEGFRKWREHQERRDLIRTFGESPEDRLNWIKEDIEQAGRSD